MEENKIHLNKELLFEILRFLVVGGTATIVDYIIYYLFRQIILPPSLIPNNITWDTWSLIIATALGVGVGLIVNWLLSISFVFKNVKDKKKSSSTTSFIKFTIIGLIGLGITELGMQLVNIIPEISLFGISTLFNLPLKEWFMKCLMTGIVLIFNYIARKIFIFK